ncbi:MAG: type II toxin-antitoxin system RelE/ParE family toxin, partial [Gemmatimonadetes bacterium]|nr:type II toxin-antitoxin system RelE/ParE family toxin [Gemmatimonadota bacterium]
PPGIRARYFLLTDRMEKFGPNLGMPHTRAMGNGLFELRLRAKEGIARVFFCTIVNRKIVMLHSFVKKSQQTPKRDLDSAIQRMREIKQ